jgi:hypothetical protein
MKLRGGIALPSLMAGALLLMLPSASKASNLLQNPGFETETGAGCSTSHASNCNPSNWTLANYAFVVSNPVYQGNYAIDLTGLSGTGGSASQSLNLGVGSYTLTFELDIDDAPNTTQFWTDWDGSQIGATIDGQGSHTNNGYQLETINFTVNSGDAGTHNLVLNDDWIQGDFFVDNTSLTQNTPPVPEPGSLVLFGSGMLGLAGLLRRKLFKA